MRIIVVLGAVDLYKTVDSTLNEPVWRPLLPQLLSEALGSRAGKASYSVVKQNDDQVVLMAELTHKRCNIIIKLALSGSQLGVGYERMATLHKLVAAQTDIEMADILAVDATCHRWPWQYLIKIYIPGQEWAAVRDRLTGKALTNAYRQIGHAVGQLHHIQFASFGALSPGGDVEANGDYLAALKSRACRTIKTERLLDIFLTALESRRFYFSTIHRSCLCHDDLHQHNLLFRKEGGRWRLATILDFDKAWAGHNESDLARLDLWRGMIHPAFWSAYRASHSVDEAYTMRRPIYQLLWCLEVAWPTARHVADTAEVCLELGLPPIERFDDHD